MRDATSQATSSQLISPIPPDADGKSLVPIDQEEPDYAQLKDHPEFAKFLNQIGDYATAKSNSDANWNRRSKSVKMRKYVLGEYFGIYDRSKGWVNAKEEGDGIYYDPQTATFINSIVAQLVKTKPQNQCEARNPERIDHREAARVAEKLLAIDESQDSNPKRQQREWKWNILTAGETYRITYFNPNKVGAGVSEDVFEPKLIEGGDSANYCSICGATSANESGACAECGNPQMDEFKALGTTITVHKGTQFKQIGDVDYDVPDALEMTVIGDTDAIGEALIVMRDRLIPRCVLEDALGEAGLPDTAIPDNLHYKQLFDSSDTDNSFTAMRPLHYQEFWVAPAVLASYKTPSDTLTVGGTVIPTGAKAKEMCPNGLYFSRVEKKICLVWPQGAGECLSHTVNSIGEGFHGQGEWDLAELQDQATEAKSMKMNSMLLDSTQPLMIRQGIVDAESFENKFGLVIEIPEDASDKQLDDMMRRVPVGTPPREAYELGQEIKGEMQQSIGAFSTQSDAPDIKAMGTATGIAAISEQTIGRRSPALQLYAQMCVDQAYQRLEMRQQYWCRAMYDPIAKDLGEDAVRWFMQCNIRRDILITVTQDSWMPKTNQQKMAGLEAFLQIASGILAAKGDPKMLDEVLRLSNDVFGGGLNFNDFETESVEAQLRLDKLREVGAFVEKTFGELGILYDPITGSIRGEAIETAFTQTADLLKILHPQGDAQADIFYNKPLDVMLDQHSEFEEAYSDWLKTAEGRAASLFIRTLVWQLADYHTQAVSYRSMRLNQLSKIPQIPDLEEELTVNDAMHAQGMEQEAAKTEQAMLYEGIRSALAPPPEAGGK